LPERQRIVVLAGLPGSGKTAWLAARGLNALSSDELRRILKDDPADQSIHRIVFAALRRLLRIRLELGMRVTYVDATNLSVWERRAYIKLGQQYGCDVEALFFDEPLEVCLQRNKDRIRAVPEETVRQMACRMVPPATAEGFTRVVVVSTRAAPATTTAPETPQSAR
jgi:predicted kinase